MSLADALTALTGMARVVMETAFAIPAKGSCQEQGLIAKKLLITNAQVVIAVPKTSSGMYHKEDAQRSYATCREALQPTLQCAASHLILLMHSTLMGRTAARRECTGIL
jgi:hypothetical protein